MSVDLILSNGSKGCRFLDEERDYVRGNAVQAAQAPGILEESAR